MANDLKAMTAGLHALRIHMRKYGVTEFDITIPRNQLMDMIDTIMLNTPPLEVHHFRNVHERHMKIAGVTIKQK